MLIERKIRALDLDDKDYTQKNDDLRKERAHYIKLDKTEGRRDETTYDETGIILADYWPTLSPEEQREFMLQNHMKFVMDRWTGSNHLAVEYKGPMMTKVIRMVEPAKTPDTAQGWPC